MGAQPELTGQSQSHGLDGLAQGGDLFFGAVVHVEAVQSLSVRQSVKDALFLGRLLGVLGRNSMRKVSGVEVEEQGPLCRL